MAQKFSSRLVLRVFSIFLLAAVILAVIWADRSPDLSGPLPPSSLQPRPLSPSGLPYPAGSALSADQLSSEPVIGQAAVMDVSPPLSEIHLAPVEPAAAIREMGVPGENDQIFADQSRPQIEDPVLQSSINGSLMAEVQTKIPSLIRSIPGTPNISGVYPPDPNGDIGKSHYVQMVNLQLQIWDKTGKSILGPVASNTIWSGFGAPCATNNDGDPIVLYDQLADRWLLSQFTASSPFGECIAISTTGSPTGSYYRYFFKFSTTVFYDYPKLAVWPDGYYLTANRFEHNTQDQWLYQGSSAIALERSQMLIGQPAQFNEFQTSTSYNSLLPADLDGSILPPVNSSAFIISLGGYSLQLWKIIPLWSGSPSFKGPTSIPIAPYNGLCTSTRSCVEQPGTSVKLDGIGDRLMHRLVYRNFGDHETLLVSHSVNAAASGTKAGVRWYELRSPNSSPVIFQQGTFSPDSDNRWMPSIAIDRIGNIAAVYSVSSSTVYPGIRYAGRLAGDPLGQLAQSERTLISGSGSQTGTASRWGDYAMISVDPVDGCTFWMTSEYIPSTGTAPWQTQIGSFAFSNCLDLGTLTGVVLSETTNRPLTGATVVAQLPGAGSPIYQTTSDEMGIYQFDYLPAGVYTVSASLLFYKTTSISGVTVQVGATSKQDLVLKPSQITIFAPYFSKNLRR